ncbi:MAG: aldo/keto reductase [Phycisphaerales bacterium]|nr:aldo/keto reductase [Phycisphaerales bacterium]
MRYRTLGRTGIKVSEIGFGCWTMGGPNWSTSTGQAIGWADVKEEEVLAGVKAGLDAGVNHWDNADIYGNGRAERMLGSCLDKLGIRRDGMVIATKVGHFRGTAPYAYEPRHIRNQCEQSLRNLRADHIDVYYFHHGSYTGPGYDSQPHDYLHEAADTMHALVKEGKVRAVGQSAYSDDDFERAVPVLKPDVLQTKANLRFDDFIRPGCRLQQLMRTHGCTLVAFGPLDQGILLDKFDPEKPPAFEEGDYRRSRKDFAPETLREVRARLGQMKQRFAAPGVSEIETLSSAVQQWVLAHDHVCSVIPGFRNQAQARCNLRAAVDPPLGAADVEWARGLFHKTA